MKSLTIVANLLVMVIVIETAPQGPNYQYRDGQDDAQNEQDNEDDLNTPAKYKYSYKVENEKFGDFKTHQEERNGDVVKGEYSFLEPDGNIRTVKYTVDKGSGFKAVVTHTQSQRQVQSKQEEKQVNRNKHQSNKVENRPQQQIYEHNKYQVPNKQQEYQTVYVYDQDNNEQYQNAPSIRNYKSLPEYKRDVNQKKGASQINHISSQH